VTEQERPSATEPDWSRERPRQFWDPAARMLRALRCYQRLRSRGGVLAPIRRRLAVVRWAFWSAIAGTDIPLNSRIEGGLMLPHANGVVIHPDARIGPNCILFQQVTLGTGPVKGLPDLEGEVLVGAGAKILGGVRLGAHCRIGANAVVVRDVPAWSTAVGVPARNLEPKSGKEEPPS
jgi:serine O-acetyltransferase